jgi:hypothetical protein
MECRDSRPVVCQRRKPRRWRREDQVEDDRTPEAGTTDPTATEGEGARTDADAEPAGGGAGDKKVTIPQHEYIGLQKNAERLNVVESQVTQLLSALGAGRPAPTTGAPAGGGDGDETGAIAQRAKSAVARLRHAALVEGNEDALAVVAIGEQAQSYYERARIEREMDKIPEAEQDAVEAEMARTGIRSPKVAYKLMRESKMPTLEAKVAELEQTIEALRKQRPPAPVDTRIPAASKVQTEPDAGKKMGLTEYNAAYTSGDPARIAAAKVARQSGNVDLSR